MELNDAQLIQQILRGDQDAFSPLVKKYQKGVHTLVWRKIGDFHVAQEITQDTFLKAYQKLGTLKNYNQFPGWLYVIASNLCRDWLRRNRLPIESLDTDNTNEVDKVSYSKYLAEKQEADADETRREIVKKLLKKLPESERTVMMLHYLGEMTIKAISEFVGVSQNTVKSRLSRARNRLKKEENMIHQNLGSFQLSAQLTENIMRQVSRITPTTPAGNKPMIPWMISAASAVLILLLMGVGTQYLSRFQQPYNLNATSERSVEIIEALFVLDTPAKPDVRNQAGSSAVPGKSAGAGQKPDTLLFAAVPVDEVEVSTPKPQWIQTKGPEGGTVNTLFVTSNGDLFAGAGTNLYRIADDGQAWNLINFNTSFKGSWQLTERNNTLYVVTDTEVLASEDKGQTWNSLGVRPEGQLIGVVRTDDAFYLGLVDGVYRSIDAGKSWTSLNDGDLTDRKIRALAAIENSVFVGTDSGLYRHNSEGWKQLPVGEAENIRALASAEHRLYVAVGEEVKNQVTSELMSMMMSRKASLSIYRSTDFGDSWQAVAPGKVLPVKTGGFTFRTSDDSETEPASSLKMAALQENVLVLDSGRSYYSSDAGENWTALYSSHSDMDKPPVIVMLNENTFYRGGRDGVHRTTDAGKTWQQFNTGLVNTGIMNLAFVDNTLYANIGSTLLSSSDGGESWAPVPDNPGNLTGMIEFNGVLYARGSEGMTPQLFYLLAGNNTLTRVPDMPDLGDSNFNEQLTEDLNLALLGTLQEEDRKSIEDGKKIDPEHFDADKFNEAYSRVMEKSLRNSIFSYLGSFAVSDGTYYMESSQKLFRWKHGTAEWYDTGLIDEGESTYSFNEFNDLTSVGFKLAVSDRTVYVGKRSGHLFQSFDEGDTWNDVTTDLPFSVSDFNVIAFAGSTVYIATDKGVAYSNDGTRWHTAFDVEGTPVVIEKFAVDGTTVYGATEQQVYQLKENSNTWHQVTPEVPSPITSITISDGTLYVGTLGRGVLRFTLNEI
jgi:RNA polymerase sigma factor (sigma-70 family)